VTTPSPDLPDWASGQQAVTVPTLLGTLTVPKGGSSPSLDVSAFSSVFIAGNSASPNEVYAQFVNDKTGIYTGPLGSTPQVVLSALLNCSGKYLTLTDINNTQASTFKVYGFGRPVGDSRVIVAGHTPEPYAGSTGSVLWSAGATETIIANLGAILFQGPAFLHVRLSLAAATGFLYAQTTSGVDQPLCDSAQMFAAAQGGMVYNGLVAFPANVSALWWTSESANTYNVTVQATPNC
jgi:hypothetical protein